MIYSKRIMKSRNASGFHTSAVTMGAQPHSNPGAGHDDSKMVPLAKRFVRLHERIFFRANPVDCSIIHQTLYPQRGGTSLSRSKKRAGLGSHLPAPQHAKKTRKSQETAEAMSGVLESNLDTLEALRRGPVMIV